MFTGRASLVDLRGAGRERGGFAYQFAAHLNALCQLLVTVSNIPALYMVAFARVVSPLPGAMDQRFKVLRQGADARLQAPSGSGTGTWPFFSASGSVVFTRVVAGLA